MERLMTQTKKLEKMMTSQGFYLARKKNHFIWKHTTYKGQVVTPKTPSDHRAFKNIQRDINSVISAS